MNQNNLRKRLKRWIAIGVIPPQVYLTLMQPQPNPYSPVLDYAVIHHQQYENEVVSDWSNFETSQEARDLSELWP